MAQIIRRLDAINYLCLELVLQVLQSRTRRVSGQHGQSREETIINVQNVPDQCAIRLCQAITGKWQIFASSSNSCRHWSFRSFFRLSACLILISMNSLMRRSDRFSPTPVLCHRKKYTLFSKIYYFQQECQIFLIIFPLYYTLYLVINWLIESITQSWVS